MTSSIQYPLKCNALQDNHYVQEHEIHLLGHILDDFQEMKVLMSAAKKVGCETLYQFTAAALASWFRRRSIKDVNIDLRLDANNYNEAPQLSVKEIFEA